MTIFVKRSQKIGINELNKEDKAYDKANKKQFFDSKYIDSFYLIDIQKSMKKFQDKQKEILQGIQQQVLIYFGH